MDKTQIGKLAGELEIVASIFDPKDAAAIHALVLVGTQLNDMIAKIRTQADTKAVWEEVRTNYAAAVAAFHQSTQQVQA